MLYSIKLIQNSAEKNPLKKVFFVIKKKTLKKAVDRNRAKRIVRNAYRDASLRVSLKPTKNIVFFLERDIIREKYALIVDQMEKDILHILKK